MDGNIYMYFSKIGIKYSSIYNLLNMYMKADVIIIASLFVAIILITLWFSTTPVYGSLCSASRMSHSAYEGFRTQLQPLEYADTSTGVGKDDLFLNHSITAKQTDCKKVSGFEGSGIFCSPSSTEREVDIFSKAKGDGKCFGKSSGYSNSKGALCMDDNMNYLLSSRGANATGGDSQIGSKI